MPCAPHLLGEEGQDILKMDIVLVFCLCGSETSIRTSLTSANPQRRFFYCKKNCGFGCWSDPPYGHKSINTQDGQLRVFCSCGSASFVRTSLTPANPGRRFHCCIKKCGFVSWNDPPMCSRSVVVIPGLLRSMNAT
ncbi:hypothetical protein QVD17_37888 [Tagetes erecta]|uniref:GRF-type domain-containing protein n=1 Tax=Tagetes erecta TaxID=13708 RepID=A0AAD8K1E4_TARER|nr:hypothetical protein QVD17_37888 [Tagetes erecta]